MCGQHGRRAIRRDCNRDITTVDDGAEREGAQLRPVGHVDRYAERPGEPRYARVLRIITRCGYDERSTTDRAFSEACRNDLDMALLDQRVEERMQASLNESFGKLLALLDSTPASSPLRRWRF